jgi:hypothetical protein
MVNTYDPADRILYVHMAREVDPHSIPLESGRTYCRLAAGYANRSQRSRLKATTCDSWPEENDDQTSRFMGS